LNNPRATREAEELPETRRIVRAGPQTLRGARAPPPELRGRAPPWARPKAGGLGHPACTAAVHAAAFGKGAGMNLEKQIEEAHRRLDVRDRFRLLTDFIDAERKMIEVADHKARFGLVIMGALNAALLLLVLRGHAFDPVPEPLRPWLPVLLLPYAVATFVFLLDAVRVLQPHMRHWPEVAAAAPAPLRGTETAADERPLGIMYWGAAAAADFPRYARLWTEARVGQASTELALLAYELARVNAAQYNALRRMFQGLRILLVLAAAMLGVLAFFALR
jgi:hypothetical protein